MMFIYKITEVKICVSLNERHEVTFAETDGAALTSYLGPHKSLF